MTGPPGRRRRGRRRRARRRRASRRPSRGTGRNRRWSRASPAGSASARSARARRMSSASAARDRGAAGDASSRSSGAPPGLGVGQHREHAFLEGAQAGDRLLEAGRGAGLDRLGLPARALVAAERDDGAERRRGRGEVADQRHPVAVGQAEVDHHHVGPIDREMPAGRMQAVGAADAGAALGGVEADGLGGAAAVLDEQDGDGEEALAAQAAERAGLGFRGSGDHGPGTPAQDERPIWRAVG